MQCFVFSSQVSHLQALLITSVTNWCFRLLKEPLSKVSAKVVLLKYDDVKVRLKVWWQGLLCHFLHKGCHNGSKLPRLKSKLPRQNLSAPQRKVVCDTGRLQKVCSVWGLSASRSSLENIPGQGEITQRAPRRFAEVAIFMEQSGWLIVKWHVMKKVRVRLLVPTAFFVAGWVSLGEATCCWWVGCMVGIPSSRALTLALSLCSSWVSRGWTWAREGLVLVTAQAFTSLEPELNYCWFGQGVECIHHNQ